MAARKAVIAGLLGGLAGAWTMNQFQALMSRASAESNGGTDRESSDEQAHSEDEDATQRLEQAIAEQTIDRRLSKDELTIAGPVVHYSYGTLMGAVYAVLAERFETPPAVGGAAYGTLLWAAGDESAVPLFGLSRPSTEFPVSTHVQALAAHLVYGITTDLVYRCGRAI